MEKMALTNDLILQTITPLFGEAIAEHAETYGMLTLTVDKARFMDLMHFLYNHELIKMQFLTDLCAVHYPDHTAAPFQMVYQLHNLYANVRLRVKVNLQDPPVIPTLTTIFEAANWLERETYDFYGVKFVGHPNLKRILNIDDLPVFPQRKEYPLEDNTRYDKNDKMFGREDNPYFKPLKEGAID